MSQETLKDSNVGQHGKRRKKGKKKRRKKKTTSRDDNAEGNRVKTEEELNSIECQQKVREPLSKGVGRSRR